MKEVIIVVLFFASLALAEYPRYGYRGPPMHYPPRQQFVKKYPPGPPMRRPPMHKNPVPAGSINRPVAVLPPMRPFWKGPTTARAPIYQSLAPVHQQKFQSSPPIPVQNNKIPVPIKTIKQVGEKGPIHTIPAPNLTPADKPLMIEEVKPKRQEVYNPYPQIEELKPKRQEVYNPYPHQYQVTELTPDFYQLVNAAPYQLAFSDDTQTHPPTVSRNDPFEGHDNEVFDSVTQPSQENFYASLPSKETADTLAQLQAAGQLNTSLQNPRQPIKIYVPDDSEAGLNEDEYTEDMVSEEREGFGHRITPKIS